ncbi:MAG: putative glycoside hydrolase [Patescibacteria group bacterium]|nr:putative glycoside hydrolase [Patescibacteria group bacterium]
MLSKKNLKIFLLVTLAFIICGVIIYFIFFNSIKYTTHSAISSLEDVPQSSKPSDITIPPISQPPTPVPVTHIQTPNYVKAVYLSSWVAGSPKYRDPIIKLIDDTELNSIVIDIKDSTGRIGYITDNQDLNRIGSVQGRIPNIRSLINTLHQKNIYVIGRIAVFQDPYMTKIKPEWSIVKNSDGKVWKDNKGLSFLDPANQDVWKYIVSIALDAHSEGFDEINFDYIRYPSDGNIQDINYHLTPGKTRSDNLESFFKYLSLELKKDNITMSADLFGLTTTTNDDMGIGQLWEKTLPYFDFVSPMVYPSHYPSGQYGFKNPADHPYEVISKALQSAIKKTKAMQDQDIHKIRPWLQDFDLGAVYTKDKVRLEMQAVYDSGLNSWMLWDPKNKYTPSALKLDINQ